MKKRNGFVSNSSSSSFIVIFPREPKSIEDVKNMLFDENETMYGNGYGDDNYSVLQVAETVWKDICGQKKNDYESAKEEFSSGHIDSNDAPDYDDFKHITDWNDRWESYRDAREKYAKKKVDKFLNMRKFKLNKINNIETDIAFYTFEYADENGSYGSALEHGNLFRKVKHIRISKH